MIQLDSYSMLFPALLFYSNRTSNDGPRSFAALVSFKD